MKYYTALFAIILLLPILLMAQPAADFSATPLSGAKPLLVNFTDLSTSGGSTIDAWQWEFGDGGIQVGVQNPSHTYTEAGIYTVTLIVRDGDNLTDSEIKTDYITVDGPSASFSANPDCGVQPLLVAFTDLSSNIGAGTITTYSWDFGDGSPASAAQNPSHTYSSPGSYTVTLTITNSLAQTDTFTETITVASVDFSASVTSGVLPFSVDFSDLSTSTCNGSLTYSWDFGDGGISTERNPVHTYTVAGTYTVSLTVDDGVNNDTETKTSYITVLSTGIVATAQSSDNDPAVNEQFTVDIDIDMSGMQAPDNELGSFTAQLSWDPTVVSYVQDSNILAGFAGAVNSSDAANGNLTFNGISTAGVGGTFTVLTVTFDAIASAGSIDTLSLSFSDMTAAGTFTNLIPFLITNDASVLLVDPPVANFGATPLIDFEPADISFTDSSTAGTGNIISWSWDFGDASTPATSRNPLHTYNSADTFSVTLTVTDVFGESASLTRSDYVTILPSVEQTLLAGWNMIGAPVIPRDSVFSDNYEGSVTSVEWDGSQYVTPAVLEFGAGYWVNYVADTTIKIPGPSSDFLTKTLLDGWNMVAGVSGPVPLSTNILDPDSLIQTSWIGWTGSQYVNVDTLFPGNAYWVLTEGAGDIGIFTSSSKNFIAQKPLVRRQPDVSGFSRLRLTDAAGNTGYLYLDVVLDDKSDWRKFQLPPLPPKGAFDVRFSDNSSVLDGQEGTVSLQVANWPLQVELQTGTRAPVKSLFANASGENGNLMSYALEAGRVVEINSPGLQELQLSPESAVADVPAAIPAQFDVAQNYPNPFNPSTTIRYGLPAQSDVEIVIFNALGQQVHAVKIAGAAAGYHTFTWDTRNGGNGVGSGIYFYQVKAGAFQAVRKMLLLK